MYTRSITLPKIQHWLYETFLIVGASYLFGLSSLISFSLPFTVVPLVFSQVILMAYAASLGKKRACLAVIAYLVQGALGVPLFSLGRCGITHLLGPLGGYLLGYLASVYVASSLFEIIKTTDKVKIFLTILASIATTYLCGWLWLSCFIGWQQAFLVGIVPFIACDIGKSMIGYSCVRLLQNKLLK